jgi:hypothetical protein
VAAVGLIFIGWWGSSDTASLSRQVLWLNVGVAGAIVGSAGIMAWLLAGRRAVGKRRRRVLPDVAVYETAVAASQDTPNDAVVAGPRMTRYHRASCMLVARKPAVRRVERKIGGTKAMRPCGVCRPEPLSEQ